MADRGEDRERRQNEAATEERTNRANCAQKCNRLPLDRADLVVNANGTDPVPEKMLFDAGEKGGAVEKRQCRGPIEQLGPFVGVGSLQSGSGGWIGQKRDEQTGLRFEAAEDRERTFWP